MRAAGDKGLTLVTPHRAHMTASAQAEDWRSREAPDRRKKEGAEAGKAKVIEISPDVKVAFSDNAVAVEKAITSG